MKLYYNPGVCSLSPHIVLSEAGYDYELEQVDLKTKITEFGKDFNSINSKSSVPFLELDNGETLTEGPAIVQYLADGKPESSLVPTNGSIERVRVQEWLNYITSEFHKAHYPLFYPDAGEQAAKVYLEKIKKVYSFVSDALGDKPYLTGETFTVADAYMFTVINWSTFLNIDLSPWPVLVDYQARIAARPAVQKAMREEGLIEQEEAA